MLAVLSFATSVLDFINRMSRETRAVLLPALLTVGMQLMLYTGWHVMRADGNIRVGLQTAFNGSGVQDEVSHREVAALLMQAELQEAARSSQIIERLLAAAMAKGGSARARLAVIHNGVTGITGVGMLKFDIVDAVAQPGRQTGVMVHDQPLTDWGHYLPTLLRGECDYSVVQAMTAANQSQERARLDAMGAVVRLVCPLVDTTGQLLGGVFLTWDANDPIPKPEMMPALSAELKDLGRQMAIILTIKPTVTPPK